MSNISLFRILDPSCPPLRGMGFDSELANSVQLRSYLPGSETGIKRKPRLTVFFILLISDLAAELQSFTLNKYQSLSWGVRGGAT